MTNAFVFLRSARYYTDGIQIAVVFDPLHVRLD